MTHKEDKRGKNKKKKMETRWLEMQRELDRNARQANDPAFEEGLNVNLVDFVISNSFGEMEGKIFISKLKGAVEDFRRVHAETNVPLCPSCFFVTPRGNIFIDERIAFSPERKADMLDCARRGTLTPITSPESLTQEHDEMDSDLFLIGIILYLMLGREEEKRYPFDWGLPVMEYVEVVRNGVGEAIRLLRREDLSEQILELLRCLLSSDVAIRRTAWNKI